MFHVAPVQTYTLFAPAACWALTPQTTPPGVTAISVRYPVMASQPEPFQRKMLLFGGCRLALTPQTEPSDATATRVRYPEIPSQPEPFQRKILLPDVARFELTPQMCDALPTAIC